MSTHKPSLQSFSRNYCVRTEGQYYLQHPENMPSEPPGLLVFLHGMGQADSLFDLNAPPRLALENRLPCPVLSPLCNDMRWDIDRVLGLIEEVQQSHKIDQDRIYVTGISIGGLATWEIALRRPDRFAAIAPICGAGQPYNAFRIKDIPAWAFHGETDGIVPPSVSKEMVESLRQSGGQPRLTIYPDEGHACWDRAYADDELWQWLFHQKRNG